jgi:hypothetical protein
LSAARELIRVRPTIINKAARYSLIRHIRYDRSQCVVIDKEEVIKVSPDISCRLHECK